MEEKTYKVSDEVFLRTDPRQHVRIITAIIERAGGVEYELASGSDFSKHSAVEISKHKNVNML